MASPTRRTIETPLGPLTLAADDGRLVELQFGAAPDLPRHADGAVEERVLDETAAQLDAYFAGELRRFELPCAPVGTAFQSAVWAALREIPYGATSTYGEIARQIGRPDAVRAVGAANGRNPIAIIVPCHRVIGADGTLTGYGGGLPRKRALLELEGVTLGHRTAPAQPHLPLDLT